MICLLSMSFGVFNIVGANFIKQLFCIRIHILDPFFKKNLFKLIKKNLLVFD